MKNNLKELETRTTKTTTTKSMKQLSVWTV